MKNKYYVTFLLGTVLLFSGCSDKYNAPKDNVDVWGKFEPGSYEEMQQTVGNKVLFTLNSSDLTIESKAMLQKQVEWLDSNDFKMLVIEGHADERGTSEYNLALGNRRAYAVKNYLIKLGIAVEKIDTISYGKERPEMIGHNEEAWSKNRRGVVVMN